MEKFEKQFEDLDVRSAVSQPRVILTKDTSHLTRTFLPWSSLGPQEMTGIKYLEKHIVVTFISYF